MISEDFSRELQFATQSDTKRGNERLFFLLRKLQMTDYGRNFGFDTDMEMDFTEHSQKRGKSHVQLQVRTCFHLQNGGEFRIY